MMGEFPELFITMNADNDVAPFTDRDTWLNSTATMTSPNPDFEFEDLRVRIRGRGRSSWSQHKDKRSIRLRFRDGNRHLLDSSHAHRDWVLVANHGDKSLQRNYTAYHLAGLLEGMEWSPFARFVHLHVDGKYMGVYLLADERSQGEGRVELAQDDDPALCEYLIEQDWRLFRNEVEGVGYFRINTHAKGISGVSSTTDIPEGYERDQLYELRYPRGDYNTPEHVEFARAFMHEASSAIRSQDWARILKYVDIPSMIDYYLVQELFKNVDTGFSSVFITFRGLGDERRLYMGPVWDFDVAAGNTSWMNNDPDGRYAHRRSYRYANLSGVPEFRKLARMRFAEFQVKLAETAAHVREMSVLFESDFARNFERHNILGKELWPNPDHVVEIDTFEGQVEYMLGFLEQRAEYLAGDFKKW